MNQTTDTDSIIDEIHCTRRQIAKTFGYDLAAIIEDARKRQAASDRPEWRRKLPDVVTGLRESEAVASSKK